MSLKFGSWHHRASSRRENTFRRMQRDSVKRGYGRVDADGGWGFLKKKPRKKKIARMLILLNFLVNCHLLRNASFGYFFNLN